MTAICDARMIYGRGWISRVLMMCSFMLLQARIAGGGNNASNWQRPTSFGGGGGEGGSTQGGFTKNVPTQQVDVGLH